MNDIQSILILLAAVAFLAPLAECLKLAQPIAFVLAGLLLSLIPRFPAMPLDPEIVFLLCMPPLLYSQAYFTSWREFRREWQPISLLAVGLVIFTTIGTGIVFHWLIPGSPYAAGFVLGAIISPPDAVAVAAVSRSLRLPHRLITIMEGESLVNDATGLVALKFAVAALATGQFALHKAAGEFLLVAGGGIGVGLTAGWILSWIRRRTKQDSVAVLLSLLSPFAAYIPADHLGLSGVLSVVSAGVYLGWDLPQHVRFSARLQGLALWQMVEFLLNGLVFLLIGLQLRFVVEDLRGQHTLGEAVKIAAGVCAVAVILRPLWVFTVAYLRRLLSTGIRKSDPMPPFGQLAVLSWAGVRGVVSLAAALALPDALPGGKPFPSREIIVFATFAIILVTLVFQGLTFPWLVRKLDVRERANHEPLERKTRARLIRAALETVEQHPDTTHLGQSALATVKASLEEQLSSLEDPSVEALGWSDNHHKLIITRRMRIAAVQAQRRELMRLRTTAEIPDNLVHSLTRELDFEEARLQF